MSKSNKLCGIQLSSVSKEDLVRTMTENYMENDCLVAKGHNKDYIGKLHYRGAITTQLFLEMESFNEALEDMFWDHVLFNKEDIRELINAALGDGKHMNKKEVDKLIYNTFLKDAD